MRSKVTHNCDCGKVWETTLIADSEKKTRTVTCSCGATLLISLGNYSHVTELASKD